MSGGAIVEALDREGLLCPLEGGLVRVPHLVRGRLVAPPAIGADEARAALAAVPFERACALLEDVAEASAPEAPLGRRLRSLVSATSDLADVLLDAALATNAAMLRGAAVREVVDRELGVGGVAGSRFLDGWVELDAAGFDGPTAEIL
ncbi:MAG: hypothetical protein DMD86_13360, partial [Candidatus Rokuibacteriota bacterium]